METSSQTNSLPTAALIGLCLALSAVLMVYAAHHEAAIQTFVRHAGILAAPVMIALYGVLGMSPIPSEPLTLINGAVFDPLWGTLIAGTGNLVAAVVEYYIGAGIGNISNFEAKRARLPFGLGRFPADSIWFLLFARFAPGYGPKVVSVIGGVYRVPLPRYIWTAAIPAYLGAALFALGGHGLLHAF